MREIRLRVKAGKDGKKDLILNVQPGTYDYLMISPVGQIRISAFLIADQDEVLAKYEEVFVQDDCPFETTVVQLIPGSRTRKDIELPGAMKSGEQLTILTDREPKAGTAKTQPELIKGRTDFNSLPEGLPVPEDDGACEHLKERSIPEVKLASTAGRTVSVRELSERPTVFFFYPRTGRPDEPAPVGWDEIPGARGCTPHSCGFRDLHGHFKKLGVEVFGVSTQTTEYQQEMVERLKLPYEVLSDAEFKLMEAMRLPSFEYNGMRLYKRMAWVCNQKKIVKVFYPVFPPDQNSGEVLTWLRKNPQKKNDQPAK